MNGQMPVAGVTLLSVLMMVTVSNLMMGRAAETWLSQVRHEQEADLIFFGEQYKWAIEQYWAANGRPPSKLEELCPESSSATRRYIRRCFLDPITGEEFRLIRPGEQGMRKAQNEAAEEAEDEDDEDDDGLELSDDDGPRRSEIEFTLPGRESEIETSGVTAFIGVASDSDEIAFREYADSEIYSEWEFVAELQRPRNVGRPGQRPRAAPRARPGQRPPGTLRPPRNAPNRGGPQGRPIRPNRPGRR